jgi:hypothetical protein
MAHIAHQPGPVCLESGVSRWLVGLVGWGVGGGGAAPEATRGAWGASSIRVPKKNARCPGLRGLLRGRPARDGCATTSLVSGRGNKTGAFHNPQALSNMQEESLSCARDQVVIARPPVLTPL